MLFCFLYMFATIPILRDSLARLFRRGPSEVACKKTSDVMLAEMDRNIGERKRAGGRREAVPPEMSDAEELVALRQAVTMMGFDPAKLASFVAADGEHQCRATLLWCVRARCRAAEAGRRQPPRCVAGVLRATTSRLSQGHQAARPGDGAWRMIDAAAAMYIPHIVGSCKTVTNGSKKRIKNPCICGKSDAQWRHGCQ